MRSSKTRGLCAAVAAGPDPAGSCTDQGATSCGTDGKCQTGACEKYQQGTSCSNASCPASGTTYTPGGSCDGAGTCVVPGSSNCFPFACGLNACKATCASDGDCAVCQKCSAVDGGTGSCQAPSGSALANCTALGY